jgi:hypothetical protein
MSEKPIIFSTDMVQAIMDGRKSITRRVIPNLRGTNAWFVGRYKSLESPPGKVTIGEHFAFRYRKNDGEFCNVNVPLKYREGDTLWGREIWAKISDWTCCDPEVGVFDGYIYKADWGMDEHPKWRPSIYMPREAARLFLTVKNVRAERLQDITEEDAWAEGCNANIPDGKPCALAWFHEIWEDINAIRGYGWENNPWVWRVEFEVVGP